MVCCALISILLAILVWPLRSLLGRQQNQALTGDCRKTKTRQIRSPHSRSLARVKSFGYALDGLGFVVRNEHNARIHIAAAMIIVIMGIALDIKSTDWLILVIAIASVWFAETINTAFEYLCDLVTLENNQTVKRRRISQLGAVLIAAGGAAIVGTIILLPMFIPILRTECNPFN